LIRLTATEVVLYNTVARVKPGWNSLHSTSTIRKLRFLHQTMTNGGKISVIAPSLPLVDDMEALSLVRECRELDERKIQV